MRITIFKAGNHITYHLNPNSVVGVRTIDVLSSLYYHLDTTGGGAFDIDRKSYDRIVAWIERQDGDSLKPCPFCGAEAQRDSNNAHNGDRMDEWEWFSVYCPNCFCAQTPQFETPAEAVFAWNRRAE